MKASKRLLFVAVIFGLITVIALNYYLQSLTSGGAPALANAAYTEVVVAKSTIPEHTRITAEMLVVEPIPTDAVHPEAIKNTEEAVGSISRSEIVKGEQLLAARVAAEGRASLSYRVPEKRRAISLPVSEVTGVSGYISPGDKVDVLITYSDADINSKMTTYTVVQNALVLATGEYTKEQDSEERHLVSTITLAVTPGQAEVLAYALLKGSFHFTLRSPLDEEKVRLEHYNAENFGTFRER
ncbi:MAG: Flp pilus assembly protein CpaB [Dethiobacteria bacterium]